MDARFTQIRTDAKSHPRSPLFHSCISHNCKIRFFGNALEGAVREKKKGSPCLASLSLLTHGHRAGGRIRDYPSQKDPIPEVTLQRVPLSAPVAKRKAEQLNCPGPSRPAPARSRNRDGTTPRPTMARSDVWRAAAENGPQLVGRPCPRSLGSLSARSISAHARRFTSADMIEHRSHHPTISRSSILPWTNVPQPIVPTRKTYGRSRIVRTRATSMCG